jgi:hypothetical protein
MKLADESMLFCSRYPASRTRTSRTASPSIRATSNIDFAFITFGMGSLWRLRSSSTLTAFCVSDRLPDDSMTTTRSPAWANTRILEKRAIWSKPALVRESDAKIIPASSAIATQ